MALVPRPGGVDANRASCSRVLARDAEIRRHSLATEQWVVLVMALIVLGVIVSMRFLGSRNRELGTRAAASSMSLVEQSDQREDRRIARMSAEDQAWEQASLQRHRDAEARTQGTGQNPV
jgi:hypothetical protein